MIHCIGLASGLGAGNSACGKGPLYLQKHLKMDDRLLWKKMILPEQVIKDNYAHVAHINNELAKEAYNISLSEPFFLSFGGDHSSGIGTWSGVAEAKRTQGDIGLIWIDAHMDAHIPETSPSGNIHGMPVALLLGHGDKRLSQILSNSPKVKPENMILIGIRSYEKGEADLLKNQKVRIYFIEEVQRRGFNACLEEAIKSLTERTVGYGISFDLDAIDPTQVDAVGTPVPNGIDANEAIASMELLADFPPLAFELVEYNPDLDVKLETFQFTEQLLKTVVKSIGAIK